MNKAIGENQDSGQQKQESLRTENSAEGAEIANLFQESPRRSIKWSSYFPTYQELLKKYSNKPIALVEVGVLNGGSLPMWRNYIGPSARIIGVDLNPLCKHLENDGFEIFIGNASDPEFWKSFYERVGNIDVLIDDGPHTNLSQLVALFSSLHHINDGGAIIVEDTHASYMQSFGNPSRYSFIKRCMVGVDEINRRNPLACGHRSELAKCVHSISFYESIVHFSVNRKLCEIPKSVTNSGVSIGALDQRLSPPNKKVARIGQMLEKYPRIKSWLRSIYERYKLLSSLIYYAYENRRRAAYYFKPEKP